ncbi:MAG TPA: hypothetical protein VE152_05450 [Acidimicrobiales bacterium]|nr:hypothetical protein [Acidimicrobiales bacterium]
MLLAQLAPAIEGIRLSLHVFAAAVWVGGQATIARLVPTARRLGEDAPRQVARAFSRLSWPAYVVLLGTGVWNIMALGTTPSTTWQIVLGVKVAVVLIAGLAAWLHGRARNRTSLAVWGAITGTASSTALVMGVLLAG